MNWSTIICRFQTSFILNYKLQFFWRWKSGHEVIVIWGSSGYCPCCPCSCCGTGGVQCCYKVIMLVRCVTASDLGHGRSREVSHDHPELLSLSQRSPVRLAPFCPRQNASAASGVHSCNTKIIVCVCVCVYSVRHHKTRHFLESPEMGWRSTSIYFI